MKEEDDGVSQVHRELHSLVEKQTKEGGVGIEPMHRLLMVEGAYCMGLGQNTYTIQNCLDTWIENFRQNLIHIRNPGAVIHRLNTKAPVLVVGAGPSARTADYSKLHEIEERPFIICTNKSLSYLIKDGIVPDVVTVLHSTDEIRGTIRTDAVRMFVAKKGRLTSRFMVPTTVDPEVYKEIISVALLGNLIWFNPCIPEEHVSNVSIFMERMSGCPTIDPGGNVGIFAFWLALNSTKDQGNEIGIIGLEHCLKLDPSWTNKQSMRYRFEYMPESDDVYAIPPSFQTYIEALVHLYNKLGKGRVTNLAPYGPVHARKIMPYLTMEEFLCRSPI